MELNRLDKAEYYGKLSYNLSKKLGYPQELATSSELLRRIYVIKKDYKNAYRYLMEAKKMNDSIVNAQNKQTLVKQQVKYQYQRKAALDSLAHIKELQIKNLEIRKQAEQKNFLIIGILITLITLVYIFRNYKQKIKMNLLLNEQKKELETLNENLSLQNEEIKAQRDKIETQKHLIEAIYNELSESINYAQDLQTTIFPSDHILKKNLNDYFILFKPKDKVSGDFYWWTQSGKHLIVTVADCTGHGVPGAFMSMLGITLLKEIVEHNQVTDTARILRIMRREIINILNQRDEHSQHKDGIDMAILRFDTELHILQFSGANNKALLISRHFDSTQQLIAGTSDKLKVEHITPGKVCVTLQPDKMPVGIYRRMDKFTSVSIQLEPDDIIYLFSDGYADQFGGAKQKKFKHVNFKKLLLRISNLPLDEQKNILDQQFENWKNRLEQTDDVTIGGFRLL